MSSELVSSLAKKDADFLEKLVRKILDTSIANWAQKATSALANSSEPGPEYTEAFNQWHLLRQCLLAVDEELVSGNDRTQEPTETKTITMAEIQERKQASRDEDARALASGEKTREDLQKENSIFAGLEVKVNFQGAIPLK